MGQEDNSFHWPTLSQLFSQQSGSQKSLQRMCPNCVQQECMRMWDLALTLDIINHGY